MSRRTHHPTRRHPRPAKGAAEGRPGRTPAESTGETSPADAPPRRAPRPIEVTLEPTTLADLAVAASDADATGSGDAPLPDHPATDPAITDQPTITQPRAAAVAAGDRRPPADGHGAPPPNGDHGPEGQSPGCTAPQLRRFIKSRAYVPMHELRRRFGIEGDDDEVTGVEVEVDHRIFIGLPNREGRLLGELFRAGDVGYELSMDPISPIVVGVFPMRPIARG